MIDIFPRYESEAHRRQGAFLVVLKQMGVSEERLQKLEEIYPVEEHPAGYYSWNSPADYQDLAGIARISLPLAQKAFKELEKPNY